jgi:hypothetical protein
MITVRLILSLTIVAFVPSQILADDLLPRAAKTAIRKYEAELAKLEEEYEVKRIQARAELAKTLFAQEKEAVSKGKTGVAKRIESERENIKSVSDRDALRASVVGHEFQWEESSATWRFLNDGTIAEGDIRFPWVVLNTDEILMQMRDGSLRILQFNTDRTKCHVRYLPTPIAGKGGSLSRVK